jgi:CheY-like chemotaxis protein
MARILWIDDNQSTTELVGDVLERLGHQVTAYASAPPNDVPLSSYDLVVVDLYLGAASEMSSGRLVFGADELVRLLRRDRKFRRAVRHGETKCLLLSQHLTEYGLRERLRRFTGNNDVRSFLRSKDQDREKYPDRSSAIASVIDGVLNEKPGARLEDEIDRLLKPPGGESYFAFELGDFRSLPDPKQAVLQEEALARSQRFVQDYFATHDDVDWIILSGEDSVLRDGKEGPLPSALDRRIVAETLGHPILTVTRPKGAQQHTHGSVVEDGLFWRRGPRNEVATPNRCDGIMNDYPILHISMAEDLRTYHFDTGSDANFIRASIAREHGCSLYTEDRVRGSSGYGRYFTYELPAQGLVGLLEDQVSGSQYAVTLFGYAIEQFENWEHSRRCYESDCSLAPMGDPCLVRTGLIGRRFLGDNELVLELDSAAEYPRVRKSNS